jgi:hypothetical protein
MANLNVLSAYVLSVGLLSIFVLIWVALRQRNPLGMSLGFAAGATGVLLGSIGSYAILSAAGFEVTRPAQVPERSVLTGGASASIPVPPSAGGPMAGGPPTGPAMMPMMGGMGGGMGGGRGPAPKRDLTTLVRKLDLLTGNIGIKLESDQLAGLMKGLVGVEEREKMSDDDAKAMHEELLGLLSDSQKEQLDAIGLPFGARPGGGGGGGGGAGGGGGFGGGGFGGGGGGGPPDPDANPFKQQSAQDALKSMRTRFGVAPAATSADPAKPAP